MEWHIQEGNRVLEILKADGTNGLSQGEVQNRLERYGKNTFSRERQRGLVLTVLTQLKNPLVIILLLAGLVTILLGEFLDALVVFVALFINVAIGTFQEQRAGKAFEKLAASQERFATVIRGGHKQVIPTTQLVPGDRIELTAGSYVPADARLLSARELSVNEAVLTGEWAAVNKDTDVSKPSTPLAERANMAWMGTLVVSGQGSAVVVATGNNTEIGKIAESVGSAKDPRTPLQKSIRRLATFLAYLILGIVLIIFILGTVRGEPFGAMLLLAVAVAVSVIPEGLPAAVTAVLAIGMERILRRKGLVRNLLAAETLGSTTVILTDKTGTLTEARMRVSELHTLSGEENDKQKLTRFAVMSSDAFVEEGDEGAEVSAVRGRPMERAIVTFGMEHNVLQDTLEGEQPRLDYFPFEAAHRFAASLNKTQKGEGAQIVFSGAPEVLFETADFVINRGRKEKMTDEKHGRLAAMLSHGAREGKRFIGISYRDVSWSEIPRTKKGESPKKLLNNNVFVGLVSFSDPLRADAPAAIQRARQAGAQVIMLTGDNKETAQAIAHEAGIFEDGATVLEGSDLEQFSNEELLTALRTTRVFARVLPEQKLRIAKLLQKHNEIVAMTGDGVNDAPALRTADIGVAVGSGTEVAKEASDLILLNDSFSIIVAAIEEGRRIIDNLKKVVTHLLSTSFHEIFIIAVAVFAGLPLPVLPVQILWMNIIQEGFLTFGFAFEPAEEGIMKRNPRTQEARTVLTKHVKQLIFIAGLVTSIFSVGIFLTLLLVVNMPIDELRTVMFVVLALDAIFFALSLKNLRRPFWHSRLLGNRYLLVALAVSMGLLVLTLTAPPLRTLLSLVPLSVFDVLLLVGVAAFNLLTIEVSKKIVFRKVAS